MGCHFLLQGVFPAQGWNLCLLHLLRWHLLSTLPPGKIQTQDSHMLCGISFFGNFFPR